MALPQRDDLIEEIKRTDTLQEYTVPAARAAREPYRIVDAEAERLRATLQ